MAPGYHNVSFRTWVRLAGRQVGSGSSEIGQVRRSFWAKADSTPSVVIPNTEIGVWLGGVRVVFTEAQLLAMVEQAA
jgi:hypothetical protein